MNTGLAAAVATEADAAALAGGAGGAPVFDAVRSSKATQLVLTFDSGVR